MTLAEKIGQMTLVEKNSIVDKDITALGIGALLSGGGGAPRVNQPQEWLAMVNDYQEYALDTRLAIPLLYGIDAVHGHSNVYGAVLFPHNIGLGAAGNAELVDRHRPRHRRGDGRHRHLLELRPGCQHPPGCALGTHLRGLQ